jgi:hypothetical protein
MRLAIGALDLARAISMILAISSHKCESPCLAVPLRSSVPPHEGHAFQYAPYESCMAKS